MADDSIIIRSQIEADITVAEKRIATLEQKLKEAMKIGDLGGIDRVDRALDQTKNKLANLKRQLADVNNTVSTTGKETKAVNDEMTMTERIAGGLAQTMAAVFSVKMAKDFISQLVQVRGQFQQFEVAMETLLGNKDKADALMKQSIELAAKTPFYVSDVVAASKQLLAYGQSADDVVETVRRLGDIAAGVSIPLNRVVGIYGRIMAQGKLTNLTMKQFYSSGIPIVNQLQQQLGKTKDEIMKMISAGQVSFSMVKQAFTDMTNEGGKFGNMMEKQSHTITGHINVIKGLIQNMFNEIGKDAEGPIENILSKVEDVVKNYEKWGKVLASVITVLGASKAATVAYAAIVKSAALSEAGLTIQLGKNTIAQYSNIAATKGAKTAQQALNKAILANPYILILTALVAATAGVIAYSRANNFALQSQKRLDKAISDSAAQTTKEMSELNQLAAKLESAKKGTDEWNEAKKEAVAKFGQYKDNLDAEIEKTGTLGTVYEELAEKIRESSQARAYSAFMEKQEEERAKALEKQYGVLLRAYERKYGKGSIEAYREFYRTLNELAAGNGLSEEVQASIDELKHSVGTAVGGNLTNAWVGKMLYDLFGWGANEAQDAIDTIEKVETAYSNAQKGAQEAMDLGSGKTEMQKALDELSDEDLSELISQLETARSTMEDIIAGKSLVETISPLSFKGSDTFGGKRYAYTEFNETPVSVNWPSLNYGNIEALRSAALKTQKSRVKTPDNGPGVDPDKAAAAAARRIKARENELKAEKAIDKAQRDAIASAEKEQLDLMEDGLAKKLAQADYEKRQQLAKIEEQKDAYIEKLKELERAKWKVANPDSKGEWDSSTFKLTPEQEEYINALYGEDGKGGTLRAHALEAARKTVEKSLDEVVKEYGDHYAQQAQLVKEWDKKIAETEAALTEDLSEEQKKRVQDAADAMKRKKALELAEKNYDAASQYGGTQMQTTALTALWEARIADAAPAMREAMERKMAEELSQLKAESFKNLIDWDAVFGNMDEQSTAALKRNMAQVKAWLEANRDSLKVDELRDIEEALANMSAEIGNRTPIDAIRLSIQELAATKAALPELVANYKAALADMAKAREQHAATTARIEAERAAGNVTDERKIQLDKEQQEADAALDTATAKLTDSTQKLNAAQRSVTSSSMRLIAGINGMRGALREGASSVQNLVGLFDDDAADVIGQAIDLFTELGDVVSEIASKMVQQGTDLIEDLQETAEGTAEAVQGTAEATSAAISAAEAASVVLLVIKAVIIALTAVFRIVKANDEAEKKAAEAAREYAQALREVEDAANKAKFANIFGSDTFGQFRRAKQMIQDINKELKNTVSAAQDNALWMLPDSWRSKIKSMAGDFGYTFSADMRSGWQKFWGTASSKIVHKNLQDFVDEDGNIMTDALKAWADQYSEYLSDNDKKLIDELLSQGERYEEAMDDIRSYLEGIFGDTASSIADSMIDAFEQTGDAAANFEELMNDVAKNIAKSWVVDKLIGSIFNEDAEKKMSDMLAANNVSGAVAYYNSLIEKANESAPEINEFLRGLDVDWTADQRQGQTKNSLGASQDSVDESNARLTTIQGHTFLMSVDVAAIRAQNEMLSASSAALLEHVQGIHANTNEMRAVMLDMKNLTAVIRSGVSTIVDRGVKMQ